MHYKFTIINIFIFIFSILLCLLCAEGLIRVYHAYKESPQQHERAFDPVLGWKTIPNQQYTLKFANGEELKTSTTKHGFKVFGNLKNSSFKIFVIGDSITQSTGIPDGYAYYHQMQKSMENTEFFVYGCGGYGNLQEYMILDQYIDLIKPDLILWQLGGNDLINNDHKLESSSLLNNNHMLRPYYVNSHIEYLFPYQVPGWLYPLIKHSHLIRFIKIHINASIFKIKGESIEYELNNDHPLVQNSIRTTEQIFKMAKERAIKTPIIAFSSDISQWDTDFAFKEICKKVGITYISDIPKIIQRAKDSGHKIEISDVDTHWNALGHKIAANLLTQQLKPIIDKLRNA